MKTVKIQSSINLTVFKGNMFEDNTDHTNIGKENRIKIRPAWFDTSSRIELRVGKHEYPAEVVEWTAIKSLAKSGKITIEGLVLEESAVAERESMRESIRKELLEEMNGSKKSKQPRHKPKQETEEEEIARLEKEIKDEESLDSLTSDE